MKCGARSHDAQTETALDDQSFRTTVAVENTPAEVFAAINNVRGWWSGEIGGGSGELGDEFTYRYEDIHRRKQKITELIPGQRVVWHVLDAYLNVTEDKTEWNGTDITFDISREHPSGLVLQIRRVSSLFERPSIGWQCGPERHPAA